MFTETWYWLQSFSFFLHVSAAALLLSQQKVRYQSTDMCLNKCFQTHFTFLSPPWTTGPHPYTLSSFVLVYILTFKKAFPLSTAFYNFPGTFRDHCTKTGVWALLTASVSLGIMFILDVSAVHSNVQRQCSVTMQEVVSAVSKDGCAAHSTLMLDTGVLVLL